MLFVIVELNSIEPKFHSLDLTISSAGFTEFPKHFNRVEEDLTNLIVRPRVAVFKFIAPCVTRELPHKNEI
jgi:hypothetical protein